MSSTRLFEADDALKSPAHHGTIVGLEEEGDRANSVPVTFHLGQTGLYGSLLPENQSGLGGLRLNSTALLEADAAGGKAIVRIGERDIAGLRFPFSILRTLGSSSS